MNYRKTLLLHGFNVRDKGSDTIMQVASYLPIRINHMIINYPYGWLGLLGVLFKNKKIARELAAMVKHTHATQTEVHIIGHSNGCAIIVEAARQGAIFDKVVLINPALNIDTDFPASMKDIVVIHTTHDIPTRTARFFDAIPFIGLLIPDAWGAMGAIGYTGDNINVINIDGSNLLKGHSDFFEPDNLAIFMPTIGKFLDG